MAQILKYRLLHRLRHRHRLFIPIQSSFRPYSSGNAEMHPPEFAGMNAYDILGVSSTSSFAEIKASFRNLAKETHPDLAQSQDSPHASDKFIQILAAYEVLSFFLCTLFLRVELVGFTLMDCYLHCYANVPAEFCF